MKPIVERFRIRPTLVLALVSGAILLTLRLLWLDSEGTVDKSVLTDLPCAPPCWQGITPGDQVMEDEIVQLLNIMPSVDHVWQPISGTIAWYWKRGGANSIYRFGTTVNNISLSFNFRLTVAEIVEKYGIPEAVNWGPPPLPEESHTFMNLFYPTLGLQFITEVSTRFEPTIESSTRVSGATYFGPEDSLESWLDALELQDNRALRATLQPWPGYGKLPALSSQDLPPSPLSKP
jgi:hypothetical protein